MSFYGLKKIEIFTTKHSSGLLLVATQEIGASSAQVKNVYNR